MTSERQHVSLRSVFLLVFALTAAWLLWSGLYKPLILFLGLLSLAICFWIVLRMRYFDEQLFALRFSFRLFRYWLWLGREIIVSSLAVTRAVLDPRMPISPTVLDIRASSEHPFDHVILGNSITLTPGTLSLDVHRGVIKVHALTEQGARDLASGEMDRRVTGIRGV